MHYIPMSMGKCTYHSISNTCEFLCCVILFPDVIILQIPFIIAKLDLDVDVSSRFGRYDWPNFLKSPTPRERTKCSMIFEYNYAQFGDQSDKRKPRVVDVQDMPTELNNVLVEWKESYPLPTLPSENFPVIPFPPPPTWCERPGAHHGHFDWSIPLQPVAESSDMSNLLTSSERLTPPRDRSRNASIRLTTYKFYSMLSTFN